MSTTGPRRTVKMTTTEEHIFEIATAFASVRAELAESGESEYHVLD